MLSSNYYNIIFLFVNVIINRIYKIILVFKSGYAKSLLFLSLIINFISLPLYNIAESWQAKEKAIQEKMKPMIYNIKASPIYRKCFLSYLNFYFDKIYKLIKKS
ncbi:hypothetical protein EPJ74_10790 [Brachyspira aalborgi]|uniref:Uncharacterized protein n=1 Tax=Brachyspira aalborgi TaxID=29522 RepID=A0A5C8FD90_9SPIR|nr:hypothetical protein EPJ78_07730 [Brachyspira aalborgi]TXJ48215.1 hypothetical protein EPJ84_10900 [Brachyspira aalborgi]TXJ59585.1 hypothetical protein EPJ74_10790 [Brachyspira aalborgi]